MVLLLDTLMDGRVGGFLTSTGWCTTAL